MGGLASTYERTRQKISVNSWIVSSEEVASRVLLAAAIAPFDTQSKPMSVAVKWQVGLLALLKV